MSSLRRSRKSQVHLRIGPPAQPAMNALALNKVKHPAMVAVDKTFEEMMKKQKKAETADIYYASPTQEQYQEASGKDKVIGWCLVGLSSIIFIYYTIWVIILPFVDKKQRIHDLFPDIVYAVAIPLITGVLGLLFIGSFIVITLLRAMPKDKSS